MDSTIRVREIAIAAKSESNHNLSVLAVEDSNSVVKLFESGSANEQTLEKLKFQHTIKKTANQRDQLLDEEQPRNADIGSAKTIKRTPNVSN
jgi:hypothetical protein